MRSLEDRRKSSINSAKLGLHRGHLLRLSLLDGSRDHRSGMAPPAGSWSAARRQRSLALKVASCPRESSTTVERRRLSEMLILTLPTLSINDGSVTDRWRSLMSWRRIWATRTIASPRLDYKARPRFKPWCRAIDMKELSNCSVCNCWLV